MNTSALGMISIPIASYNEFFKAQLDFFGTNISEYMESTQK